MEATGRIIAILPQQSGVSARTGNQWCKQTFVIETDDRYPKKIPFDVFGADRIAQFNIQMGETVSIKFDIDSEEYNGKYYPHIQCYNLSRVDDDIAQQTKQPQHGNVQPQAQQPVHPPYNGQQQYYQQQQQANPPQGYYQNAPQQPQDGDVPF